VSAEIYLSQPVRGTQKVVNQMGWVLRRPLLTLLEIAWRWLFALPFLYLCWLQMKRIAAILPPDQLGLSHLSMGNPWLAAVRIGEAWAQYEPYVLHALAWMAPLGIVGWSLMAGLGRAAVLKRMEPGVRFRPFTIMALQAGWLLLLCAIYVAWYESIQWVAITHITPDGNPDLVGYFVWVIFLSLGFFSLFALASWPFTVAPLLALLERRSALSAMAASFKLGKPFTSKLMETNLDMGIVKLMIIVLAMVISAAPLPFAQELGSGALHFAMGASLIFYCVASDYFHVVRQKGFIEFWRVFRGYPAHEAKPRQTSA
jgi:hypothetical protein